MPSKYFILAGEVSGDMHGASLIEEIKKRQSDVVIQCWGGDAMQAQGAEIKKHIKELAFMGLIEVLVNLFTILKNFTLCKKQIESLHPDLIIFIDYPGFNFPILKWAKKRGYRTLYYIPPQLWAWKKKRAHILKKYADQICTILPFEKKFYKTYNNTNVHYVGHPLVEQIEKKEKRNVFKGYIVLAPGSRKQEVTKILPTMLNACKHFPSESFVITRSPIIPKSFYSKLLTHFPSVRISEEPFLDCLIKAKTAIVTSGTATLETALAGTPEIVVYKMNSLSFWVARLVVKVKYISLVNLIMNKPVVKELIQSNYNVQTVQKELHKILHVPSYQEEMLEQFQTLQSVLKTTKTASASVADIIFTKFTLNKKTPLKNRD